MISEFNPHIQKHFYNRIPKLRANWFILEWQLAMKALCIQNILQYKQFSMIQKLNH